MSFVDGRWNKAEWRPLGPQTEPSLRHFRVIIDHTIAGSLRGAEAVFRPGGYDGTEAHFGVGGPWDGLDGIVWQWQDVRHTADAEFAGNMIGIAVEHSDGGNPHNAKSTKQLRADIELYTALCKLEDLPARLVTSPTGKGIGYHELFPSWNLDGHVCPGPVREGQLRTIIIPKVRARLAGEVEPKVVVPHDPTPHGKHHLEVDGILGAGTIAALQSACGLTGPNIDGIFGPQSRRAFERHLGTDVDGSISGQDVRAMQAVLWHLGAYRAKHGPAGRASYHAAVTGRWTHATTRALQRALNEGNF